MRTTIEMQIKSITSPAIPLLISLLEIIKKKKTHDRAFNHTLETPPLPPPTATTHRVVLITSKTTNKAHNNEQSKRETMSYLTPRRPPRSPPSPLKAYPAHRLPLSRSRQSRYTFKSNSFSKINRKAVIHVALDGYTDMRGFVGCFPPATASARDI